MERNHRAIRAADSCTDGRIVLTDENSLVGAPRLQTSGGTWATQRLLTEVAYFKATYWLLEPSRWELPRHLATDCCQELEGLAQLHFWAIPFQCQNMLTFLPVACKTRALK